MAKRPPVRYPARSDAMRGNKNRALAAGKEPQRGVARNMSMTHKEWEAFKAACDLEAGRCIDDDREYKAIWRDLCSSAVQRFIKAHHGLVDPEVLIV